jgi:hypothetical protein
MVFGKVYLRVTTSPSYLGQTMTMNYFSGKLREDIGELQVFGHGIAIL